jgi:rubrerythrin
MSLTNLWDNAIEIQGQLSACYAALSRTPRSDASRELKTLAAEEENHVSVLRAGKNVALQAPGDSDREKSAKADIESGLESVEDLQAAIEAGRIELSEALRRLSILEEKFEKFFLEAAIEAGDFSLKKLFEVLARAYAEHRRRLGRLLAGL